jgi:hypothetical protein
MPNSEQLGGLKVTALALRVWVMARFEPQWPFFCWIQGSHVDDFLKVIGTRRACLAQPVLHWLGGIWRPLAPKWS